MQDLYQVSNQIPARVPTGLGKPLKVSSASFTDSVGALVVSFLRLSGINTQIYPTMTQSRPVDAGDISSLSPSLYKPLFGGVPGRGRASWLTTSSIFPAVEVGAY